MSARPRTRAVAREQQAREESTIEPSDGVTSHAAGDGAWASSSSTAATSARTPRRNMDRPETDDTNPLYPHEPPRSHTRKTPPIVTSGTDEVRGTAHRRNSSVSRQQAMSPLDPISPWPPAEPETPYAADLPSAKEVYGLLGVLLTYLAFAIYLVWAFAPSSWLDRIGWTWYPNRQWAVVVPCWLMILVLTTYWSYAALTAYLVPSFDDPYIITDERSNIPRPVDGAEMYYWKFADPQTVPEAVDLPIDLVNRVLYPPRPRPQPSS